MITIRQQASMLLEQITRKIRRLAKTLDTDTFMGRDWVMARIKYNMYTRAKLLAGFPHLRDRVTSSSKY